VAEISQGFAELKAGDQCGWGVADGKKYQKTTHTLFPFFGKEPQDEAVFVDDNIL
jgi:hypothetical protein